MNLAFSSTEVYIKKTNIKKTWEKIYQECFGLRKNFSDINIPKKYDPKKHFPVIVAKGLTIKEVVKGMKFRVDSGTHELATINSRSDRTAKNGDYIVLFFKNIEADEELKGLSAQQLEAISHKGITWIERLLLEVLYYNITKKHLDCYNRTLCSGSRPIQSIFWNGIDGVLVSRWCYPDAGYKWLRSRTAIT